MVHLVMVRHGQSQWNLDNRFTGWIDIGLTRAIRTLWLMLGEMDRMWLPQTAAWQLNERHYGALQGLNKTETGERHGAEQLHIWRRSYDVPPPPLDHNDERHPRFDPRYRSLATHQLPATESLKATLERALPYWEQTIRPYLVEGQNVLISAHGNSVRALCKHLMGISDQEIPNLEIPTGNPLHLVFDKGLTLTNCSYLEPSRATKLPV
jgi:2,3-bisphosphoglycerate-dependent phosphoglycerate mutase